MLNDNLPYAEHASPWYRPGYIKISDGTHMSMISPIDCDLMGIVEIGKRLNISLGVMWQLAKVEKIPYYKYNMDSKAYYEDDFIDAYEKHKPPEGSEKKQSLLDKHNRYYNKLKLAIIEGHIKPVHSIGNIDYYNVIEFNALVTKLKEANK